VTAGGRTQIDEVMSGSSYYSQNSFTLHFGLGSQEKADVEIRWPNGLTQTLQGVSAGHLITVREGVGIVKSEPFPGRVP
jgi:hypothetical protein